MKKGAHIHKHTKLKEECNLIVCSIEQKVFANVFVIVDTYLKEFIGMLQHSSRKTGVGIITFKEILSKYLSPGFRDVIQRSSNVMKSASGKPSRDCTWYNHSAFVKGRC